MKFYLFATAFLLSLPLHAYNRGLGHAKRIGLQQTLPAEPVVLGESVDLSEGSGERLFRLTLEESDLDPAGTDTLHFFVAFDDPFTDEVELLVRRGEVPTESNTACDLIEMEFVNANKVCAIADPAAGDWYALVRFSDSAGGAFLTDLNADWCTEGRADGFGQFADATAPWCVLQLPAAESDDGPHIGTYYDISWEPPRFGNAVMLGSASIVKLGGSCADVDDGTRYQVTLSIQSANGVAGGTIHLLHHPSWYGAAATSIPGSLIRNGEGSGVSINVCATLGEDSDITLEVAFVDQQARMSRFVPIVIDGTLPVSAPASGTPINSDVEGPILEEYIILRDNSPIVSVPPYFTSYTDYDTEVTDFDFGNLGREGESYIYQVNAGYNDDSEDEGGKDNTEFSTYDGTPIFARAEVSTIREAVGAIWGDCDGDGDDDLFVPRGQFNANLLFRNEGGNLVEHGFDGRQDNTQGAAWGDYNNDGILDLVVTNDGGFSLLYAGTGNCAFNPVTVDALEQVQRPKNPSWADYDNDGDLDLFLANWGERNTLLRNEGGGQFTSMTAAEVGSWIDDVEQSWGGYWADYDNDRDADLFVTNLIDAEPNRLYRNDLTPGGSVQFIRTNSGAATSDEGRSVSASWGDYDNDGDLDLFVANQYSPENPESKNWLYENQGAGGGFALQRAASDEGAIGDDTGRSFTSAWQDVDNDGDLDLYTNHQIDAGPDGPLVQPVIYYWQRGSQQFDKAESDNATEYASGLRGAAFADVDQNGYADLFLADSENEHSSSYESQFDAENDNNWIRVKLIGEESNRFGIGAKVWVEANGTTQLREVTSLSGARGQNSFVLTVGVGDATGADRVVVDWPSKYQNVVTDAAELVGGSTLVIREAEGTLLPVELGQFTVHVTDRTAVLRWQTLSETNNAGFAIEHRPPASDAFSEQAFVAGHGTTTVSQQYEHRIEDLSYGVHQFRLKQVDIDGATTYSSEIEATVQLKKRFVFEPIYPNPAPHHATLRFAVREPHEVRIDIYDAVGRHIQTIYRNEPVANTMQTTTLDTGRLASGLYFVRLTGKDVDAVQKLLIVR